MALSLKTRISVVSTVAFMAKLLQGERILYQIGSDLAGRVSMSGLNGYAEGLVFEKR
jgi:hypothetical protein